MIQLSNTLIYNSITPSEPKPFNGVFPKLRLSKLAKFTKILTTDQNSGWSSTQALRLYYTSMYYVGNLRISETSLS